MCNLSAASDRVSSIQSMSESAGYITVRGGVFYLLQQHFCVSGTHTGGAKAPRAQAVAPVELQVQGRPRL